MFDSRDRRIAVQTYDEKVTTLASKSKTARVSNMQQVKAPIGKDNRSAISPKGC
jgi:hypothetical protein